MSAAVDLMPSHPPAADAPYGNAAAIAPSDSAQLAFVTRAIYVGVAGDVTAVMQNGTTVLFKAMPVGWYPLRVRQIKSTGTLATSLVALW